MTKEEAIAVLNMVEAHGLADEAKKEAIKALEQEPVLDKIRAEIEELDRYYDNDYFTSDNCPMYKCNEVLLIIDKYKAKMESEE